jgi:DNA polymerase-3 subunit alpha
MASVLLDDKTGRIEVTLFNEAYEQYRDLLAPDRVLVVEGSLVADEYRGGLGLRADRVSLLEECRAQRAAVLELAFSEAELRARRWAAVDFGERLARLLAPHRGGECALRLNYRRGDACGTLRLGDAWRVRPTDELLRQLRRLLGAERVGLRYGPRLQESKATIAV